MLKKDTNRNICSNDYDMGAFKGLKPKELLGGALALITGAVLIFIMSLYMPMIVAVYLGTPIIFVIGYISFYNKNGLTFSASIKKKIMYSGNKQLFLFSSKQFREGIEELVNKIRMKQEEKANGFERNKKGK